MGGVPVVPPRLRGLLLVVAGPGLLACGGGSDDVSGGRSEGPPAASGPPAETTTVERTPLAGFEDVVVEVEQADGSVLRWCLLLAATSAQHARGLMEVTDPALGGYDGMLFRFDEERDGAFWMRNTPLPLSIAYVDADGETVSTARMEPCADSPDCPPYPPEGEYRWAVEVPVAAGGVGRLGLPDGRLVDTGQPCSS
jgi:uncharacterized membrane protein (UPF0127 family)